LDFVAVRDKSGAKIGAAFCDFVEFCTFIGKRPWNRAILLVVSHELERDTLDPGTFPRCPHHHP